MPDYPSPFGSLAPAAPDDTDWGSWAPSLGQTAQRAFADHLQRLSTLANLGMKGAAAGRTAARDAAGSLLSIPQRAWQAANPDEYLPWSSDEPREETVNRARGQTALDVFGAGGAPQFARAALGGAAGEVGAFGGRGDAALDFWPHTEQLPGRGIINDVIQNPYPGIWKDPRVIAKEAAANVAPEDPAMKQLFGVTRDDLWEMSGRGTRQGNMEPQIAKVANPKGSYAANAIMTPQNAQRLVDTLGEAEKYPELTRGMDAWYVMDPAYQRLEQLVGPEEAKRRYLRFNNVTSMFSPGSDVLTEINRGTAANMMIDRGQFDRFQKYGGMASADRGADFPSELRDVQGHPYHSTAHTGPLSNYLDTGSVDMTQPKVPLYMQSSGVPQTGFQTKLPVPDAHFTRSVGMSDVRKNANPGASMKTPEYASFGPWYRENVASPLGIEAVPAQARQWGVYAPQTGVDTPVGAPKLELLAQRIWQRAQKLGLDPRQVRDAVLMGREHAMVPLGLGAAGAAALAGREDQ